MAIVTLTPANKPDEKPCTKCGDTKPLTDYHKRKGTKDGHAYQCKACQSVYDRRPERMEKKRVQKNARYANDPEYREGRKQYVCNYYATNTEYQESAKQRARDWAEQHHDHVLKKHRRYWHTVVDKPAYNERKSQQRRKRYKADPAFRLQRKKEGRLSAKVRKARLRGARGSFTLREWEALCERYNQRCLACGKQGPLTADHIVAVSKGGANTIDNIQPLCMSCNSRKQTKTIDYRPLEQSSMELD